MTLSARFAKIETKLSKVVGQPVELTVRGDYSFTISTDTVYPELGDKVGKFFGEAAVTSVEHDDECGSFAYVEVAQ